MEFRQRTQSPEAEGVRWSKIQRTGSFRGQMLRRTVRCEVAVRNSTDDDELELELAAALALVVSTGEAKIAAALGPAAEPELELVPVLLVLASVLLWADGNEENGNRNGNPNRSRQRDQRFVASSRCCYSWCSVEQLDQHGAEPVGRKSCRRHGSLGTGLLSRGLGQGDKAPGEG